MNQQVRSHLVAALKTDNPKRAIQYILYLIHFNELAQAADLLKIYLEKYPEHEKESFDLAQLLLQGRNNAMPSAYKFAVGDTEPREDNDFRYPDFAFCNRSSALQPL